ncbi:MAG: hypothetical protein ACR2FO_07750 [Actinomycetota bacterium]
MTTILIRDVRFSPEVVEKIWMEHGLSQRFVEEVAYSGESEGRWDFDEVHGIRVVVRGETVEAVPRDTIVFLRPIDPENGIWDVITAFCPTNPNYGMED